MARSTSAPLNAREIRPRNFREIAHFAWFRLLFSLPPPLSLFLSSKVLRRPENFYLFIRVTQRYGSPSRNIIKAAGAPVWLGMAAVARSRGLQTLFVFWPRFTATQYVEWVRNKLYELTTGLDTPVGNEPP